MKMDNCNRALINWSRLGAAVEFYKMRGYEYIEVPWAIEHERLMATCPTEDHVMRINGEDCLIGSAEQGFIALNNLVLERPYVSCSPCWRKEPVYDQIHHGTFMKVELYTPFDSRFAYRFSANKMIDDAMDFFKSQIQFTDRLSVVETDQGSDIEYSGIELGSYGIRTFQNIGWVYGTGLAEPRFSSI
jgi:seryl-tRNA synthetase